MQLAILALVSAVAHPAPFDAKSVYNRVQASVVTVRNDVKVGSGFVIGDGTLIVTCYHVVRENPRAIRVKGQPAEMIANDPSSDIAILRVRQKAGRPLPVSPTLPKPGTKIYVIGNPLGVLEKTISEGIVSAIRKKNSLALVQITAPISEGSSGGPVVDERGNVVAMVALMLTEGQALNFAVGTPRIRQSITTATAVAKKRPFRAPQVAQAPKANPAAKLQEEIRLVASEETEASELLQYGSAAVPYILEALKRPNAEGEYNDSLVYALILFGDKAQAPLLNALSGGTGVQRRGAAAALRSIAEMTASPGIGAERSPALQEWIDDRKEIFKFIRSDDVKRGLVKAFRLSETSKGSGQAARTLAYLGYRDLKDDLVTATTHGDSAFALSAFEALIVLLEPSEQETARRAFDNLYAGTTKEDLDERENNTRIETAAQSLERTRTPVGATLVLQLLRHEDWEVRYEMCNLLASRSIPEALPIVKGLLDDEDEDVRWCALAAVGNLGRGEMVDRMAAYAKSSSSDDRWWGVYAAGLTRSAAGLEVVLSRIDDPDAEVRTQVVSSLELIEGEKAIAGLKKLAKDPDADVRKAAKEALENITPSDKDKAPFYYR